MPRPHLVVIVLLNAIILTLLAAAQTTLPGDFIAYRAASELFWNGVNPYDPVQLLAAERLYAPHWVTPSAVWNPPLFFVTLALPYHLPLPVAGFLVQFLAINGTLGIAKVANHLGGGSRATSLWLPLLSLATFPLWADLLLGQFGAILGFLFFLAAALFFQRRDSLSGAIIALILIKPHLLWLPALLLGVWAIVERRVTFIASALGSALGLSVLAELLHPGITAAWLGRSEWPTIYYGSAISSLLTGVLDLLPPPPIVAILGTAVAALVFLLFLGRRRFSPSATAFASATACTHLFAPYGFVFDQVGVLFFFCFVISSCPSRMTAPVTALYLLQFAVATLTIGTRWGAIGVSWIIPELSALLLLGILWKVHGGLGFPSSEKSSSTRAGPTLVVDEHGK